ncbi:MAG: hypothetical protein V7749_13790 [Cocleimonas sp.]
MKTVLTALIITAFLVGTANADQNKHKHGQNIDQVVSSLQLESATAINLKSLMQSHRDERQALRQKVKKDREQRQALRKQHRQSLLKLLGYEKMYEFEEMMRENRPKRRKNKQ